MNPAGKMKEKLPQKEKAIQKPGWNIDNKWAWIALTIVVIATFIIYFRALRYDLLFYWDDNLYISDNGHLKELHWANIKLFFTSFYAWNYQPLTMLTYAVEYNAGGGKSWLFHFDNILVHVLNTCLVFVLIRKISPGNNLAALVTAAFFAVHPMHVESVAWVAERKDVLWSFFFLLSLIMYAGYLKSRRFRHLVFTAVFFLLSCLCKPAAVILPLLMFLFDYYEGRKFSRMMVLEKIPFFIISLIFGFIAIRAHYNPYDR